MMLQRALAVFCLLLLSAAALPAQATNLVTNGSFTNFTPPADGSNGFYSTLNNSDLSGWQTTSGYSFVVTAAQATGGFNGPSGSVSFYGPITSSPDGGYFLAADGGYQTGYTYTSVSGLTVGKQYSVSFYQAAAQQTGFTGATTDYWQVGLGATYSSSTFINAALMSDASQSSVGWQLQTLTFTAVASTEVLSFMAVGTPTGQPPFALLDGVTLTQAVPEPASLILMAVGLLVLVGARAWYNRCERSSAAA
jgi:hypothetical protein